MKEIDDLIAAASGKKEKVKETQKSHYDAEIEGFINHHNITSGSAPIPKTLVYDYYLQWSNNAIAFRMFCVAFNKRFKTIPFNFVKCYQLDISCFKLPEFYHITKDRRFTLSKKKYPKYIGVTESFSYWIARLRTEENLHYLGRFKTAKEAAECYDFHAYKHFGNDAKLNFPQDADLYEEKVQNQEN